MAGIVKHNCSVVDKVWVTIIVSAMFTSKASLSLRLVRLVSCANSFNRVTDIAYHYSSLCSGLSVRLIRRFSRPRARLYTAYGLAYHAW